MLQVCTASDDQGSSDSIVLFLSHLHLSSPSSSTLLPFTLCHRFKQALFRQHTTFVYLKNAYIIFALDDHLQVSSSSVLGCSLAVTLLSHYRSFLGSLSLSFYLHSLLPNLLDFASKGLYKQ